MDGGGGEKEHGGDARRGGWRKDEVNSRKKKKRERIERYTSVLPVSASVLNRESREFDPSNGSYPDHPDRIYPPPGHPLTQLYLPDVLVPN